MHMKSAPHLLAEDRPEYERILADALRHAHERPDMDGIGDRLNPEQLRTMALDATALITAAAGTEYAYYVKVRAELRGPAAAPDGGASSLGEVPRDDCASSAAVSMVGGTSTPVSAVITSRYPGMSEATTGVAQANASVSTMPKLSPPSEGATKALAFSSSSVRSRSETKPSASMLSSGIRWRVNNRRTCSGSAPTTRRRAPV